MRKGRPKYPQPKEIVPVIRSLEKHIPTEVPLSYEKRESLNHVPNFRVRGEVEGVGWTVDIYKGGYFHVQVMDDSERFDHLPLVLNFLRARLAKNR